jgi:hypothetical protein
MGAVQGSTANHAGHPHIHIQMQNYPDYGKSITDSDPFDDENKNDDKVASVTNNSSMLSLLMTFHDDRSNPCLTTPCTDST